MRRRRLVTHTLPALAAAGLPVPKTVAPKILRAASAELRYQGWANGVTFPELAEDLGYLAPLKLNWVGNTISGPQDIQATVTGDIDFGGAFNGSIEKLIAAGAPIQAVIGYTGSDKLTWRGLYVPEYSPIRTPRDLIGKQVGVNTLGAHYEFVIDEYLQRNGLSAEEIRQVTLVPQPPSAQEQTLRYRQVDAAILDGIFREKAVDRGGLRLLVSDYDILGEFTAASYILTKRFINQEPDASLLLVQGIAKAIEWARTQDREVVVARMQELIRRRGRNEDPAPAGYWRSPGLAGKGGVLDDRYFGLFIDWYRRNGDAAIGRLRPKDVYTNAFNPYADTRG
jgi:ABC-type nitrate/sulfonate/bicarbonate transport system substrate-binding protein